MFKNIPVESMVYSHQEEYYQALNQSTEETNSAAFVEFMLSVILEACKTNTPQVNPQVTPQVKQLLKVIKNEMSRNELQQALGLKDRKSFRERYLQPALSGGLIEMTIPDKPNSSLQEYRLTIQGKRIKSRYGK